MSYISLKKMSIAEIKSIYDFLEIKKNVAINPEHFEENQLHKYSINKKHCRIF